MGDIELILFDDDVARNWYPFTLTRPAGELLLGTMSLRQRLEAVVGEVCTGYLTDPLLDGFDEPGAPRVLKVLPASSERARLLLCSRSVLHFDVEVPVDEAATYRVGDEIAGWLIPPGATVPAAGEVRGKEISLGGMMIGNVWELIHHNHDHIASDILHMHPSARPSEHPAHVHVLGNYPLICGDDVQLEPGVVFDLTTGPIWLDDGVHVRAFTRLAGPMFVGKDSTVLGGCFAACSIGPVCKVHGEMEACVVLGYTNKAHYGFLGHAYVGKWVNLGALTTNSDLKNNYSSIRMYTPRGEVDTGELKLGSLIGDHVKTAIGTMLPTGAVLGPGANVLDKAGKHVPPFAWGDGTYEIDKFLTATERAMQRRQVELSKSQREMLSRVWQHAKGSQ